MAAPWEKYQQPVVPAAETGPWSQYGGTTTAEQPSEIPGARTRRWSEVPVEALMNLPSSAGKFVGDLYQAVTSPVQTAKGILDIGAGALQNITPKGIKDFVNQFETNPEAAQRAVGVANAVGGEYAKRYGSVEGFKEILATDPVAVISDFSTLLSGGATATGKVAPSVSKALGTAAAYTNPMAPIAKGAEYGLGLGAKTIGGAINSFQGQGASARASRIVRNALTEEGRTPTNLLAAQQALQNAPEGATVRQALAPDVTSPQVQYLGEYIESKTAPGRAMAIQEAQKTARQTKLKSVTPDLDAAEAIRSSTSAQLYGISDETLLPGRERQFKPVQVGETAQNIPRVDPITGQPVMVPVTPSDVATTIPKSTTQRAIQVEVGRDSFNKPIYETRAVSDNQPKVTQTVTRDTITNTPILKQDVSIGGQPIYKHVLDGYKYDPQLAKLMERPAVQAAFDQAAIIAANKGVSMFTPSGELTGRGAHLVKLAIDDAINPTPGTPIAKNTASALQSAKSQYLNWVESKVPAYKEARETYKLQSEPVNQAKVLQEMQKVLESPLDVGERTTAFANVLGKGEKALLKKSTGEARYTELSDVLTPLQIKATDDVLKELATNAKVVQQTRAGEQAMKAILDASSPNKRLPQFLDVKVTLTNEMLKILRGRMDDKVLKELEKAFASTANFNDLIKKVPTSDRIKVLQAMGQAKGQLSPTKLNILAQTENALESTRNNLAPQQENRNALAR